MKKSIIILLCALMLAVLLHSCTKDKPMPPPLCECAKAKQLPANHNTD
jgi:hypothetical protein